MFAAIGEAVTDCPTCAERKQFDWQDDEIDA
jgi:hypothetical protein